MQTLTPEQARTIHSQMSIGRSFTFAHLAATLTYRDEIPTRDYLSLSRDEQSKLWLRLLNRDAGHKNAGTNRFNSSRKVKSGKGRKGARVVGR